MSVSPRITYRGLDQSDAVDGYVRKRAEKLEHHGPPVIDCHVVIDEPHRHKVHGRHYVVRIEIGTRLGTVVVDRSPDAATEAESIYAAMDSAFDHAVRRLQELTDRTQTSHYRRTDGTT
jgi:ribosomal subunit interface protein